MAINNVSGVRSDINDMLSKIREVSNKSKVFTPAPEVGSTKSFDAALSVAKNAITNVSKTQTETDHINNAYMMGDQTISMSQVLVASQKSKLAFEGLVTVRNKLLEAYKDIMNMPV
jgi:flagellar hook-basal body complex protein FliE